MFEGFDPNTKRTDRRRFGMSLGISIAVYVPLIGGIVAASAHAVHKVSDEEKLVQVEFKEPPPPPPPPPPPAEPPKPQKVLATKPARAKVERPELKAPDEIPDEKPPEADTALPEAPPVDQGQTGYLTGQIGGTGTGEVAPPPPPPPPPKPKIVRKSDPVRDGNYKLPEYPRSARRAGITGTVIARIHVRADGSVAKVDILEGPDVFHSGVIEALMGWRYTPARLSDGTTTADSHIVRIPFVLN